jgi:hypothetical protein
MGYFWMTTSIDTIASKLATMSASELAKVRQLTDTLLGSTQVEAQATDDNERILFEAVKLELASIGIRSNVSYTAFSQTNNFKYWKRNCKVVSEFLENSFDGYAETEAQRLGLCRIFVQAVIQDFKRIGIPVSIGAVAKNLHRVQQAFDNSFPNYLQAGLAHLIPKMLMKPRRAS